MGLLDQLAGQVLGSLGGASGEGGAQAALVQAVIHLVQNSDGGLAGLLERLREGGLAEQVASWVGTGQNLPVSGAQLAAVLGAAGLGDLAGKLGISQDQVAGQLAQVLPGVIDHLTPDGTVPGGGDVLAQGLSALGGLFGRS